MIGWKNFWKQYSITKIVYPNSRFLQNKQKINNYTRAYKAANRDKDRVWQRQWRHKITVGKYLELLATSGGLCGICATRFCEEGAKGLRPHVDHNHATGEIRGLLCGYCNWMLGNAKDNPDTLEAGSRYLRGLRGPA